MKFFIKYIASAVLFTAISLQAVSPTELRLRARGQRLEELLNLSTLTDKQTQEAQNIYKSLQSSALGKQIIKDNDFAAKMDDLSGTKRTTTAELAEVSEEAVPEIAPLTEEPAQAAKPAEIAPLVPFIEEGTEIKESKKSIKAPKPTAAVSEKEKAAKLVNTILVPFINNGLLKLQKDIVTIKTYNDAIRSKKLNEKVTYLADIKSSEIEANKLFNLINDFFNPQGSQWQNLPNDKALLEAINKENPQLISALQTTWKNFDTHLQRLLKIWGEFLARIDEPSVLAAIKKNDQAYKNVKGIINNGLKPAIEIQNKLIELGAQERTEKRSIQIIAPLYYGWIGGFATTQAKAASGDLLTRANKFN